MIPTEKYILILGSNSFSGSTMARFLLDKGYKVVGLNRSEEVAYCYSAHQSSSQISNFRSFSYGSNFDPSLIVDACKEFSVDHIINFASQSMVAESWESPWDWYETNSVWLSKIIFELIKWGKISRFLHFSTPETYGSTRGEIKEDEYFNPTTPYAISRLAGDLHLRAEYSRSGFPVIFSRAANIYGPFQPRYRLIPKALIAALNEEVFYLHGGGNSVRSFIFMDDVCNALYAALTKGQIGETFHISTKKNVTIKAVVAKCYSLVGKNLADYVKSTQDRPGKDELYHLNSDKIRSMTGWHDQVDLDTGIELTYNWVRTYFDEIMSQPASYEHKR